MAVAATGNHFNFIFTLLLLLTTLDHFTADAVGDEVGVCFGRLGDNLPTATTTVALYKRNNIPKMRLYQPHRPTLRALAGSNITLLLGVPNHHIQDLANCPHAATAWVRRNILRYPNVTFSYISVGNEIEPASELAPFVLPAMQNVYRAIRAAGRGGQIGVSTSIKTDLLNQSYPPQAGEFKCSVNWYIRPILEFLRDTQAPLLANVYPYFAYINDRKNINLSYALLQPNSGVVAGGVYYDNLFYAILDAVYAAIDRVFAAAASVSVQQTGSSGVDVGVVVSETGYPSRSGGNIDSHVEDGSENTVENARLYNTNLMRVVGKGSPRRPGIPIETYIFAMYDENQKPGPAYERHFGIFLPSGKHKYPLRFR